MTPDSFPATREQIIACHPLLEYCKALGWELKKRGRNWECLCPLHDDKNPSFKISEQHNVWKCFGCDTGGSVIDLHAKLNGMTIGEAMRDLWPEETTDSWLKKERPREVPPAPAPAPSGNGAHEVAAYHYHDATWRAVLQIMCNWSRSNWATGCPTGSFLTSLPRSLTSDISKGCTLPDARASWIFYEHRTL